MNEELDPQEEERIAVAKKRLVYYWQLDVVGPGGVSDDVSDAWVLMRPRRPGRKRKNADEETQR